MEWFPVLKPGGLNGWVPLCAFYALFGLTVLTFPREDVSRLYDQTGWTRLRRRMSALVKLTALACFGLIFLTPLKVGTGVFRAGALVHLSGVLLMLAALSAFRNAPPDRPVASGVYRVSRNPQWAALVLVILGIALAMGSGIAAILTAAMAARGHFRILAEEQSCLQRYGESYREYMQRVPRYLLFF
jgi:hypothetical protein